jgi:Ran GTPase-activating protein (RanGAP) involved in mRNA processing and transport
MKSLKSLHILQNGIKQEGMIELFKSFVSNQDMEELRMNDNSMKGSADVFVEVLDKLQNMKVLDLSDLLIGDEFSLRIFTIFRVKLADLFLLELA